MFGLSKKIATSLAELMIIFAIIGILSVMYRKTVNNDAIVVKYAYKNLINSMISYAATYTDTYDAAKMFPESGICENFFSQVNSLGGKNCSTSVIPLLPNLTTTSGMRFFGLESEFSDWDNSGEKSVFVDVDLDGLIGQNKLGEDIFTFELLQNGRIRPSGAAILDNSGNQNTKKGNIARDPQLYAVNSAYIPVGETDKSKFLNIGSRLSYSEAQCLSGNIFPYRDRSAHTLQMCIENDSVRKAINDFKSGSISAEVKETKIQEYWLGAIDTICSNTLYTDKKSVAYDLAKGTTDTYNRCKQCHRAAYKAKYCSGVTTATTICPDAIIKEEGTCSTPQWAEIAQ